MIRKEKSKKTESPDVLADNLSKWITETMKYRGYGKTKGCPSIETLKRLCSGRNGEIWNYVMNRVRLTSDVKKIRGNLMLSSNQALLSRDLRDEGKISDDDDLKVLLQRREELRRRLVEEEETLSSLQVAVDRIKKDLLTNESKVDAELLAVTRESCSRRLTQKFSEGTTNDSSRALEMISALETRSRTLKEIVRNSGNPAMVSLPQGPGDLSKEEMMMMMMETKCFVDVQKCCQEIERIVARVFENDDEDDVGQIRPLRDEGCSLKSLRDAVDSVERILGEHSADAVSSSLTKLVGRANLRLKRDALEATARNVEREVKKLSSNEAFDCLLLDMKLKVMQRQAEAEKLSGSSKILNIQVKKLEKTLFELLGRKYQGDMLEMAKSLYEAMKRSASVRAAHIILEEQTKSMEDRISEAEAENEEMEGKLSSEVEFEEKLAANQTTIHRLARDVFESRSKIKKQQEEINDFVSKNLIGRSESWIELVQNSDQQRSKEVDLHYSVGLRNIEFLSGQSHVSVHRLMTNESWPFAVPLREMMEELEFPMHLSLDEFLPHVASLALLKISQKDDLGLKKLVEELSDLNRKVAEKEKQHVEEYSKLVERRTELAAKAVDFCSDLEVLISDWWNQPGQALVPWVKVDGLNYSQWLEEWKVAISKIRRSALS